MNLYEAVLTLQVQAMTLQVQTMTLQVQAMTLQVQVTFRRNVVCLVLDQQV
jgi:hypothetical protein